MTSSTIICQVVSLHKDNSLVHFAFPLLFLIILRILLLLPLLVFININFLFLFLVTFETLGRVKVCWAAIGITWSQTVLTVTVAVSPGAHTAVTVSMTVAGINSLTLVFSPKLEPESLHVFVRFSWFDDALILEGHRSRIWEMKCGDCAIGIHTSIR